MFWGSYLISKIIWKHLRCDFHFLFLLFKVGSTDGHGWGRCGWEGQFSSSAWEAVWLWGCLVWESVSITVGYRWGGRESSEAQRYCGEEGSVAGVWPQGKEPPTLPAVARKLNSFSLAGPKVVDLGQTVILAGPVLDQLWWREWTEWLMRLIPALIFWSYKHLRGFHSQSEQQFPELPSAP